MRLEMIEWDKASFAAVSSCVAAVAPLTRAIFGQGMPERLCRISAVMLSILLILSGSRAALAQSGAGSIQGTITDSTGSAIPGASIHVVNTATSVATDTKSNGDGFYQVPELFTGTYTVTASAPGMKTYTTSIELLVAQDAVINPVLVPGAETQEVIVTGNAVQLVTTDDGTITSTLENARINQLPMNGRSLTTLLSTTTPGLENGGKDINGLMPSAVIYMVDGVTTQDNLRGGNTSNVVNSNSTNGILPGIAQYSVSPDSPPQYITEANFTIEQPLKGNSALRLSYIYTHAKNLPLTDVYNHSLSNYQWEMATGTVPPTGGFSVIGTSQQDTYSTTALGPYDQTTWGASEILTRTGWSNDNIAEITYQRLFHHGIAYQISYVFSHDLRAGGDNQGTVPPNEYPDADYPGVMGSLGVMTSPYGTIYQGVPPPPRPASLPDWADYHSMVRYQGYMLDNTNTPIHHVSFNGILDLPFGRGKQFFGNSKRWMDEIIGGFQIAGSGNVVSQVFQAGLTNWGALSPLHVYKHRYPTVDCRSGVCEKSYLWFNGYLAPTVTSGAAGSVCATNCVSGLPASYVPLQAPIDNTPGTTYYGTNDVLVKLTNGSQSTIAYDGGPQSSNYMSKSWINGPFNYTVDLSLFKVFAITEAVHLRFNLDAFNALNVQGYNNPDSTGLEHMLTSHNTSRQIQLTGRLTF